VASRLEDSASPYLRAHAANPVAWFPWGEEAFAEARRRDVPVLISIGYSTCHWCHVMARESFSDPQTARELNEGFVSVKVDREEHPDVDEAYLAAASAFTRSLGWPLTVFATPEGRAFFAGTYFPPTPRPPVPAFRQVLAAVREAWSERRAEVDDTAAAVADALRAASTARSDREPPTAAELSEAAERVVAQEDPVYGGFAPPGAGMDVPKFPALPAVGFLQAPAVAAADAAARAVSAIGRLQDPIDGGLFRYATRRDWTVPHYERMLTDNAQLIVVALDAGREDIARAAAGFLVETLQQPSGGFAAAQDSESWIEGERSEGGYFARDADAREDLEPPALDAKVVTGWNGLAIGALARAGLRLHAPELVEAARWAADAVLETNVDAQGRLARASLDEIVSGAPAVLEDYGLLAAGLAELAAATGDVAYAQAARDLVDACTTDDPARPQAPVRDGALAGIPSSASDGDHPSGPSSYAAAALRLWLLGAGERYRDAVAAVIGAHAGAALREPLAHGALLRVAADLSVPPRQLVVVGDDPAGSLALTASTRRADVVALTTPAQAEAFAAAGFALFEGKTAPGGTPTAYDCRAFACRLPVTDPRDVQP